MRVDVDVLAHVSAILAFLPNREKRAVTEVKPFQVWDVRENEKAPWREAMVINVSADAVELQFLDMPNLAHGGSRTRWRGRRKTGRVSI